MQNVRDLLNQWEWKKAETLADKDTENVEKVTENKELTAKLNGKFDKTEALNLNWESNFEEEVIVSNSRKNSREEENGHVFNHDEEEYEEEEEEEDHQGGGGGEKGHHEEEVEDIWGAED